MATKSAPKRQRIEFEKDGDRGLRGLVAVLMRRTHKDGRGLGAMSDVELVTVGHQASNVAEAYLSGLRFLGDLVSSHNSEVMDMDTNALGWLIVELVDGVETVDAVVEDAAHELRRRGYDSQGVPLSTIVDRV